MQRERREDIDMHGMLRREMEERSLAQNGNERRWRCMQRIGKQRGGYGMHRCGPHSEGKEERGPDEQ